MLVTANMLYIKDFISVFPSCVGMFRTGIVQDSFPHVCGDVSFAMDVDLLDIPFSPRVWGCFSIATLSTGLPVGFPHVCGDVSYLQPSTDNN